MEDLLKKLNQEKITQYQAHLEKLDLSEATIKRRLSTLRKFTGWAEKEGYLKKIPTKIPIPKEAPSLKRFEYLISKLRPPLPSMPTIPYLSNAYEVYQSISITKYLHYAILIVFCVALGMGLYNQLTGPKAEPIGAYPTALTPPKRYLSFQGRLTDSSNNPITIPTNFDFKLWDQLSGGTEGTCTGDTGEDCLWKSGTCSIDPDQDGIFSLILGTTSGDGYTCSSAEEIDTSVFTENAEVWLEVKVGTETLDPRIQIATVAYALNAETLQGYPPGTAASNIPYINDGGNVVIAAASPTLQASSGTFAIEGQTGVTIQAAAGQNGNINLTPKGTGRVIATFEASTGNLLDVQGGANIGGSGGKEANTIIYGYAGSGGSTNLNLLKLEAGATPDAKFTVDASGNASAAGKLISNTGIYTGAGAGTLRINASGIVSNATWQGNLIGLTYGGTNKNMTASAGQVVYTDSDSMELTTGGTTGYVLSYNESSAPTWVDVSGGSYGPWTLTDDDLYPDSTSYNVAIGANNAGTAKLYVNGNVGIGTTAPGQELDIVGDIQLSENIYLTDDNWIGIGASDERMIFDTAGDVEIMGANVGIGTTNPSTQLHITGDITIGGNDILDFGGAAAITFDGSQNTALAGTLTMQDNKWVGLSSSMGRIEFDNQTPDEVNILDANVGIGTTAPSYLLDVAGNVNIGGTGTIGNIPLVSDNNRVLTSGAAGSGDIQYIDTSSWDKDSGDDFGSWWLAGDAGTPQSIGAGDTASIVGGTNITTTAGTTDKVTVATVANPIFSTSVSSPIFQGNSAAVTFGNASYATTIAGSSTLTINPTSWTATPTISGLVTMTSGFDSNAASTVTSLTIDGAAGAGDLTINSGETSFTSPATTADANTIVANSLTSGGALDISSSATNFSGSLIDVTLSGSNANNSGSLLTLTNSGTLNTGTTLYVKHYATGTNNLAMRVDDVSGDTTPFVIDGNGYVGIGTTGPSEALHVVGDAAITGALSAGDSSPDNHAWHVFGTGEKDEAAIADAEDVYVSGDLEVDGTIYGAGGSLVSGTGTPNKIPKWNTSSSLTDSVMYDNGTNIGIGTTGPVGKLSVLAPDTTVSPAIALRQENGPTYGFDFDVEQLSVARLDLYRVVNDVRTQVLSILRSDGKIGIGTTSPTTANLDIADSSNALRLRAGNAATSTVNNQIILSYSGETSYSHAIKTRHNAGQDAENAIDFFLWDYGTDAAGDVGTKHVLTIDGAGTGRVGIGTTEPSEAFHVVGDIALSGALSAGDSTPDNHAWHVFGTGEKDEAAIADAEDVYVSGDLEVDGTIYGAVTGSISFANITSGTNTQAAMVVGTGASLTYHDGAATSGEINASLLQNANWAAPLAIGGTTPAAGNFTSIGVTTQGTGAFTTLTSSGNSTLGTGASTTNTFGAGSATINTIGSLGGASSLALQAGTGNFTLNGVAGTTYTIGASTTTGTIAIGGTAQTGIMTLGSSSGTNTLNIAGGSGATTLNLANVQTAGAVNIGAGMTTGTITIGGTGAQTGTISLGTGTGAQTISLGTGAGAKAVTVGSTNTTSSLTLQSGSGHIVLNPGTGNVGIGTTGPTDKLDVAGGMKIGSGYAGMGTSAPADGLLIEGNVGIGTTAPSQKLTLDQGVFLNTSGGTPGTLGGIDFSTAVVDIFIAGKYAYVTHWAGAGNEISIIDISDPDSPVTEGGIEVSQSVGAVFIAGKYLYAVNSAIAGTCSGATVTGCEFRIYDISNLSSPSAVGGVELGVEAKTVFVAGKYAYLGMATGGGNNFRIYDISNPSSPSLTGSVDANEEIRSVYVAGKYAYLAKQSSGDTCSGATLDGCELAIYDISDPSSPSAVGGASMTALNKVTVSGKYAFLGSYDAGGTCSGATTDGCEFRYYDISDPSSSSSVAGIDVGISVEDVAIAGNYAYITNFSTSGNEVRIIDISNPSSPSDVGGVELGANAYGILVAGKYLYVGTNAGGNDLRIYDIAGIDAPAASIGSIATNFLNVTDNAIISNNLYVNNSLNVGPGGLYVDAGEVAFDSNSGNTAFKFSQKGTGDILNVFDNSTEVFTILNGGNVGIGTTNPSYLLDVAGNVNIGGTGTIGNIPLVSDNNRVLTSASAGSGIVQYIDTSSWDKDSGDDYGAWWLAGDAGTPQSIGAGDTATIAGGLGIGTTSSATDTLTISVDESYGFAWTGAQSWSNTATFNGTLDANSTVTLGDNGENVTIDSSVWDISGAGAGSGFTQFTVDNIDLNGNTISATDNGGLYLYDNASNGIFIEDGGNVGIGTTAPTVKLEVRGNDIWYGTSGDRYITTGAGMMLRNASGTVEQRIVLGDGAAGSDYFSVDFSTDNGASWSEKLYVKGDGNVGIGTTNPGAPLHVIGDLYVSDGISLYENAVSDGTVEATKFCTGDGESNCTTDFGSLGGGLWTDQTTYIDPDTITSGSFRIYDNSGLAIGYTSDPGQNNLIISGNVGIGTTNPSSFKLEVDGSIGPDSDDDHDLGSDSLRWANLYLGPETLHIGSSTSDEGTLSYDTSVNDFLMDSDGDVVLQSTSGNVGIGTTGPGAKLHVYTPDGGGNNDPTVKIINLEVASSYANVLYLQGGDNNASAYILDARKYDEDSAFYIRGDGNVGIGTTDPGSYKLNVAGTAAFNNAGVTIDSSNYVNADRFVDMGSNYYLDPAQTTISGLFAGNVGIGTTNPSAKLDVNAGSSTNVALETYIYKDSGTTGSLYGAWREVDTYAGATVTTIYGDLLYVDNASGGTTSYGQYIWNKSIDNATTNVYGQYIYNQTSVTVPYAYGSYIDMGGTYEGTTSYGLYVKNNMWNPTNFYGVYLDVDGGITDWGVYVTGEDKNYFSGSVGIGTTNPQAKLDIAGASSTISNSAGDITIDAASNYISFAGDNLTNILNLYVSGNVGVGTTAPQTQLHITGDLTVGGNDILDAGGSTAITFDGSQNTAFAGDVDLAGHLAVGSEGAIGTNKIGEFDETFTTPQTSYGLVLNPTFNFTATATHSLYGLYINALADDIVESTYDVYLYGTRSTAGVTDGSTIRNAYGAYNYAYASNSTGTVDFLYANLGYAAVVSGNVSSAYGGNFQASLVSGSLTSAYGVRSYVSGSATTGYGFHADCNDATTCYGLRIAAGDAEVTTDWGVYVTGEDKNYFSGDVGIGDITPSYELDVGGGTIGYDIRGYDVYTHDGGVHSFSDERLKLIEGDFTRGLNEILNLDTKYFRFKEGNELNLDTSAQTVGLIAQDLQNLIPEAVGLGEGDYLTVTTGPILFATINAIQEQQTQISSLSAQLANLSSANITDTGDLFIEGVETEEGKKEFVLKNAAGEIVASLGAFAEATIAELRAGLIEAQEIITEKLTSREIQTEKLVSPVVESQEIKTDRISLKEIKAEPGENIVVNLQETPESGFGRLIVKGEKGEEVISIDAEGNATFSGVVEAEEVHAKKIVAEEIVGLQSKFGELIAATVSAEQIQGLEERLAQLEASASPSPTPTPTPTPSPTPTPTPVPSPEPEPPATESGEVDALADIELSPDIEAMVNEILGTSLEATPQADLANISGEDLNIINSLTVLGATSLADTSIAGSLNVDGTMTLSNSSINTLTSTLYLQNLGLGGIDILAGKVTIDEQGNAVFEGDVTIKGRLALSEIEPLPEQDDIVIDLSPESEQEDEQQETKSKFGRLLIKGVNDEIVASIDASGSAFFASLGIEADYSATESGAIIAAYDNYLENGTYTPAIETNATAGIGILPAGETKIQIYNPSIKGNSLIYIVPVSDTDNKVLFVKAKKAHQEAVVNDYGFEITPEEKGWFTVAIDTPIYKNIQFNWWIVGGQQ